MDRRSTLASLRASLRRLERPAGEAGVLPLPFSGPAAALPGGGLALACLHQVAGGAAATGFAALVAGWLADRLQRPVLWMPADDELYPPGLAAFGLGPSRLLIARTARRGNEAERLWAMEEGLRCPDLACVVGEVERLSLTAGRRLQLAAEAGGVTGLALHSATATAANAGTTRWRVEGRPGGGWRLALERCRGGRPGEWEVVPELKA